MNGAASSRKQDPPDPGGGVEADARNGGWPWYLAVVMGVGIVVVSIAAAELGRQALVASGVPEISWGVLGAVAMSQVAGASAVWLAAGWRGESRTNALLLSAPLQGPRAYIKAFLVLAVAASIAGAVTWFLWPDAVAGDLAAFAGLIRSEAWWLALLVIAVGAPLMEELLFRGFLLPALARSGIGFAGAAVVTSAAWAVMHAGYSMAGLAEVFLIGLYFSWLIKKTGSLRVPLFCHAIYNLSVILLLLVVDIPVVTPR